MKKLILLTLTVLTVIILSSCSSAPAAEELEPRLRELVEASYDVNEIFFGAGLPTYPRVEKLTDRPFSYDSDTGVYYLFFTDEKLGEMLMYYDRATAEYKFMRVLPAGSDSHGVDDYVAPDGRVFAPANDYVEPEVEYVYTDEDVPNYDVVRVDCGYTSIDDLKRAAEKVYTADFLKQIYEGAFDGVAYAETGYSGVRSARFIEQSMLLRQYNELDSHELARRVYDYSTIKIIRPSNAQRVNLTIDTHLEGEDEILTVRLTLILGEDGEWYLDTPTY